MRLYLGGGKRRKLRPSKLPPLERVALGGLPKGGFGIRAHFFACSDVFVGEHEEMGRGRTLASTADACALLLPRRGLRCTRSDKHLTGLRGRSPQRIAQRMPPRGQSHFVFHRQRRWFTSMESGSHGSRAFALIRSPSLTGPIPLRTCGSQYPGT